MRIALLLRGISYMEQYFSSKKTPQTIDWNLSKDNVMSFFSGYDVDVFFHTWNHDHTSDLIDYYKPKSYVIGEFDKIIHKYISLNSSVLNVLECFENFITNNENISYDYIVITRFDITFTGKFSDLKLDANTTYFANEYYEDNFYVIKKDNISTLIKIILKWIKNSHHIIIYNLKRRLRKKFKCIDLIHYSNGNSSFYHIGPTR